MCLSHSTRSVVTWLAHRPRDLAARKNRAPPHDTNSLAHADPSRQHVARQASVTCVPAPGCSQVSVSSTGKRRDCLSSMSPKMVFSSKSQQDCAKAAGNPMHVCLGLHAASACGLLADQTAIKANCMAWGLHAASASDLKAKGCLELGSAQLDQVQLAL